MHACIRYIHYIHYITLHYITLHYITLHWISLHCITLHYITLHAYIHAYIQTDRQTDRQAERQTGRHTYGCTDVQMYIYICICTHTTPTHTHKHTHTHTHVIDWADVIWNAFGLFAACFWCMLRHAVGMRCVFVRLTFMVLVSESVYAWTQRDTDVRMFLDIHIERERHWYMRIQVTGDGMHHLTCHGNMSCHVYKHC